MAIRAYLNLESIRTSKTDRPSFWHGFKVSYHDEEPYIELRTSPFSFQKLPEGVGDATTRFSYHEEFYGGGTKTSRMIGEYRLASAVAQVERSRDSNHMLYVRARSIVDLVNLHREIRAGTIYPAIPYESEQVPSPARHIKQLLVELWAIIRRDVHQKWLGV